MTKTTRRWLTPTALVLVIGPWLVAAVAPLLVNLVLVLGDAGVPLPIMRSRADFSIDFYISLIRARLVLPGMLTSGAGLLLASVTRELRRDPDALLLDAIRTRLAGRVVWSAMIFVVVLAASAQASLFIISEKGNDYDAAQIVTQALFRASGDASGITTFRDPLSPVLLAAQIRLDPRLETLTPELVEVAGDHQIPLKQHNIVVIGLGLLILGSVVRRTVADPIRALLAWMAVVAVTVRYFSPSLVDVNMSEPHGFLMLACTGLAAVLVVERASPLRALALGSALGLLTLAKGSFLLVAPVFILLLAVLLAVDPAHRLGARRATSAAAVVTAGFLLVHAPFALERAALGEGLSPSDRGGLVLAIRAGYQDLGPSDWKALYAAGGPVSVDRWGVDPQELLTRTGEGSRTFWKSGSEFFASDRAAYVVGRPDLTHSYYARGVATCIAIESGASDAGSSCTSWALRQFRERPVEYLQTTAVRYWTGFWFVENAGLFDVVVNLVLMGALHVVMVSSLLERDARLFAMSALPVGLLAFHALATHPVNEVRHTLMTVGLTVVAVLTERRQASADGP